MAAFDAVQEVLSIFPWLNQLGPEIVNILTTGVTQNAPFDAIIQEVRNSEPYKRRFKGLEMRRQAGLPSMTEAAYMEAELGMRDQLQEYGLLGTLGLTTMEAMQEWAAERIGTDVSVQELNRRLDRGAALARDAGETAVQLFSEWYGAPPSEDAMLLWFIDEAAGIDVIEDQIAAATVGAEAFRFGLNISRTRAEILRREGVTADLAKEGFSDVARETPVLSRLAQIHNAQPLTQEELEEFFFHQDPEIGARRQSIFTKSLAQFQGAGATNRNQQGGLTELLDRDRSV